MKPSMKYFLQISLLLLVLTAAINATAQNTPETFGWKLGVQTYSFRLFTIEEA